jgi:hypothetical protein
MRAITLWQPWAWFIFVILKFMKKDIPAKRVETRSWPTKVRGRIAIHAAKYKMLAPAIYQEIERLLKLSGNDTAASQLRYLERGIPVDQFGSIIGTVEIIDCVPIEALYGTAYDTPIERALGDWSPGRYGWILSDPIVFKKSVPTKGSQGFWNWEV